MNDVLRNTYIAYHNDDVTKWKYFPRYWSFLRGIHRSPVDSSHKANDTELWCFPWSAPEQRLSKQSRRRWFETLLHSLWRHCNDSWINRVIESTSQLDCRIPVDGICYWRVCLLIGIIFDEHPLWWCGNFLHRHITYTNGLSSWRKFRHWLYRKLSFWQLTSSLWRKFRQNDISRASNAELWCYP